MHHFLKLCCVTMFPEASVVAYQMETVGMGHLDVLKPVIARFNLQMRGLS